MVEHMIPFVLVALMTWHDARRWGNWRRWLLVNFILVTVAYLIVCYLMEFIT
jgi:hypothetical protein